MKPKTVQLGPKKGSTRNKNGSPMWTITEPFFLGVYRTDTSLRQQPKMKLSEKAKVQTPEAKAINHASHLSNLSTTNTNFNTNVFLFPLSVA